MCSAPWRRKRITPLPEDWVGRVKEEKAAFVPKGSPRTDFVEPRSFLRALSGMMEPNAILCADVGQNQIWAANNFNVKEGRFLTSGGLGTMGYALPAAIGAKLAKPNRQVVCVCGDGAFQMSMCELATLKQTGAAVKIILMDNDRLGMVWEVQTKQYESRHAATDARRQPRLCKARRSLRHPGRRKRDCNAEAEHAAKRMLESDGPFLLVCRVDPDEPTL